LVLTEFGLIKLAKLSSIDILSTIIASVCHDYGHDGYNNIYHVNTISDRAIRFSDKAVQENWHAAESFKIINQKETNFLSQLTKEDFRDFRKRFTGMILSTDMTRSFSDLQMFEGLLSSHNVKEDGINAESMIDTSDPKKLFDSQ